MIFWKRVKQAINDLWYPRSVTVGKPVETQELANRIARESTVSPADTHAVLRALPNIMAATRLPACVCSSRPTVPVT